MDEETFFSSIPCRPWRNSDLEKSQAALVLSSKLWGDTENLRRQLLATSPEIPSGLSLQGLRTLLGVAYLGLQFADRIPMGRMPVGTRITVGGQQFSIQEARYEIVQRALASTGNSQASTWSGHISRGTHQPVPVRAQNPFADDSESPFRDRPPARRQNTAVILVRCRRQLIAFPWLQRVQNRTPVARAQTALNAKSLRPIAVIPLQTSRICTEINPLARLCFSGNKIGR
jgi:hypothetical protein